MDLKYAAALSLVAIMAAGVARADTNTANHLSADLAGPAGAKGVLSAELDPAEKALAFRASYTGVSDATTAEFDGPDGQAVIIVPAKLPIGGSSPLTDDMIDQIMAGHWSFKVNAPGGALAGKIVVLNNGVNP
ncbi:MAG: hypothetical protein WDN45_02040 [Caulobacteraceae bacterium]